MTESWPRARSTAARLAAHPEEHPGDDRGRKQQRGSLEDLLIRFLEATDRLIQDESQDRAEDDRRTRAQEHDPDMPPVARPGEVGTDDGDDQRRLDAFAKAGQEAAGEGAEIHRSFRLRKAS
jgi:hypothetical protein